MCPNSNPLSHHHLVQRIAVAIHRGNEAAILVTHDASVYLYTYNITACGCMCVPYFVHVSLCVLY